MFKQIDWEDNIYFINFNNVDQAIYKHNKSPTFHGPRHKIVIDFHDNETIIFESSDITNLDKILYVLEDLCISLQKSE